MITLGYAACVFDLCRGVLAWQRKVLIEVSSGMHMFWATRPRGHTSRKSLGTRTLENVLPTLFANSKPLKIAHILSRRRSQLVTPI